MLLSSFIANETAIFVFPFCFDQNLLDMLIAHQSGKSRTLSDTALDQLLVQRERLLRSFSASIQAKKTSSSSGSFARQKSPGKRL